MLGKSKLNTGKHKTGVQSLTLTQCDSAINLTKNSQFYIRQGDVERLIAQGFLQRIS